MKVTFKNPQVLGNKAYPAGTQEIPDGMVFNMAFKALVKTGGVYVHPLDAASQAVRKQKDALNARKSLEHAAVAKKEIEEKAKAAMVEKAASAGGVAADEQAS